MSGAFTGSFTTRAGMYACQAGLSVAHQSATEEAYTYAYFHMRYGDGIFMTDNNLVSNYSGSDYVASSIKSEDKYKFGLDYLVKMLCLSRCKFLVAADTSGSKFARVMNNDSYSSEYVFNLGTY